MSTLNQRLTKRFHEDDHRIVRWYGNDSEEMAAQFCAMALAITFPVNITIGLPLYFAFVEGGL
jgi:hypothetical protein